MTDYRAVMDLVLQGWSVRQICSTVRCSHTTVQKARQAMAAHQITTDEQLAGITDEENITHPKRGETMNPRVPSRELPKP
ncbi:helix-turn-helix domain-containing protein [Corynebacterium pyruviciproducens]